jgi:uncharacterized protein (TIGR00251 family)
MKIKVKVVPHSSKEEIVRSGDVYTVRVKAMPREGAANEAVINLIATHFKVSKAAVRITSGLTGRNKTIEIMTG